MKIGLISPVAFGHLIPLITIGKEVSQIHNLELDLLSTEDGKTFESSELRVVPIASKQYSLMSLKTRKAPQVNVLSFRSFFRQIIDKNEFFNDELFKYLTENKSKYRLLIIDFMIPGAIVIAEKLNIPFWVFTPTIPIEKSQNIVISIKKTLTLPGLDFKSRIKVISNFFVIKLIQSVLSKSLHRTARKIDQKTYPRISDYPGCKASIYSTYKELTPQYSIDDNQIFLGGVVNTSEAQITPSNIQLNVPQECVYMSLGSTPASNNLDLFCIVLHVLELLNDKIPIVLAVGGYMSENDFQFLQFVNEHTYRFVPQNQVLRCCKMFITHCGMNSTIDAITHEVPVVALPQLGDQIILAQKCVELGIGQAIISDQLKTSRLTQAIAEVLLKNHVHYQTNCRKVKTDLQRYNLTEILQSIHI